MASDPAKIFDVCVDLALNLCHADTSGISVLERTDAGDEIFRWIALTGQLKQHLHGTTPRFFSPCGICVDTSTPLLMRRPELVYKYLDVGPPFHDVLLIPLTEAASQLEGTIWIVSHNPIHKFELEDARMMQRIAVFIATALGLANLGQEAKAAALAQMAPLHELGDPRRKTPMLPGLLRAQRIGFPVEIHIPDDAAPIARMAEMREWLDHRRFEPVSFRYSAGSPGFIVRVEFAVEAQALAFAEQFEGSVTATSPGVSGRVPA